MAKKDKKADPALENTAAGPAVSDSAQGGSTVEAPPVIKKRKKSFFKSKWFKRIIILVIIAALIGAYLINKNIKAKKAAEAEATSKTAVVTRGDITVKITGSGTVEPIDTYNIVPTVSGTIDASYYEEGDYVEEDAVLYKFDSTQADNAIKTAENSIKTTQNSVTSAKNNIKQAENNIKQAETNLQNRADDVQKARDNIAKLTIYANSTGKVSDLALTVGNSASGRICTITDTQTLLVKIPFNAAQFNRISVGDSATVSIEKYMRTVGGTVVRKYSAAGTGSDGSVVYDVEIQLAGGIELPEGTYTTATVHTGSGDVASSLAGKVYYPDSTAVMAEVTGKVSEIMVRNGDWVQQGQVLAVMTSTDLQDALKTAQQNYDTAETSLESSHTSLQEAKNNYQNALTNLENAQSNLEDRRKDAEDYTITAPISGVILSKSYKSGDTIYGMNSTTLMVIADMSKMKFTISVDELDIAKIALGQEVEVTSDALEGVDLVGRITNISQLGSSQNGVTNYPVEVTIDEPGDLMSGMNVSAEIIVGEAFNVLRVPVTAVSYFEGKYYATVVGRLESAAPGSNADGAPKGMPENFDGEGPDRSENNGDDGEAPEHERPQSAPAEGGGSSAPAGSVSTPQGVSMAGMTGRGSGSSRNARGNRSGQQIVLNEQEQRVEVTVGLNDDDYYEIQRGLTEGQVVRDNGSGIGGGNFFSMMMGGMGGGPGGGRR